MIHHSNCGLELFTGDVMAGLLRRSLHTASHEQGQWKDTGRGPGSRAGEFIDWLTIANQGDSVVADVGTLETHPLVPPHIPVYG